MTIYSPEAKAAARELRARIKRDIKAGKYTSVSAQNATAKTKKR